MVIYFRVVGGGECVSEEIASAVVQVVQDRTEGCERREWRMVEAARKRRPAMRDKEKVKGREGSVQSEGAKNRGEEDDELKNNSAIFLLLNLNSQHLSPPTMQYFE